MPKRIALDRLISHPLTNLHEDMLETAHGREVDILYLEDNRKIPQTYTKKDMECQRKFKRRLSQIRRSTVGD
jgi:hypothetical protein